MAYIKIKNWEKYQHYKHRSPPWIKLHSQLLDSEDFAGLQDDSKLLLICLWLYNSRKGNGKITDSVAFLQTKLPIRKKINLQPLADKGFIKLCKQDDSTMQAECLHGAVPETETEKRRDKEETDKQRFLDFVFLTKTEHEKLIRKFGLSGTAKRIEELNNGIGSKGYKYKSHYFTILSWERKHQKEQLERQPKAKKCRKCSKTGAYIDTDDTGQQYWLCEDHKPAQKPLPPTTPLPQLKGVPEVKTKSLSDKVNRQKDALGVK